MRFSTVLLAVASAASLSMVQALTGAGDATFFDPAVGACGIFNTDADFIVAVDAATFDSFPGATANPNNNPICNRQLTATTADGKSVTVTVTDRCVGCAQGSIDLTPSAFSQLASTDVGRLHGVTWTLA
ncbi:RlpA-like double-psi beta-barrel-protein domain-containing protein-containing protein [Lenzites betulinus]|nr:RlpA-like double-psi beta-barrel-protein domain-containing protein-containing protein [Lenzites betulinus]